MSDVTHHLVAALRASPAETSKELDQLSPSPNPQAAVMFAFHAAHAAKELAGRGDIHSEFTDALNIRVLAKCLAHHVDWTIAQDFTRPATPDPDVRKIWSLARNDENNRHQAACLLNQLWRMTDDIAANRAQIRLTTKRRMSALRLYSNVAELRGMGDVFGGSAAAHGEDAVYFALASSDEWLRYLREADPGGWTQFTNDAGFTADELTGWVGFIVFLDFAAETANHNLFYDDAFLLRVFDVFKLGFPTAPIDRDRVPTLMKLFSLSPRDATRRRMPAPYFDVGAGYIRAAGYPHIMSPAMGLLAIAVMKHDAAWSRTLGSSLARAADVIAQRLPTFARLHARPRRKLPGGGDIDLAVYDAHSATLVLCEVKTVYDKHCTASDMAGFEERKVDLNRATSQLRDAIGAISSGAVDMRYLFGKPLPPPKAVHGALLTWLDPVDLTLGESNEDILCFNFASFIDLVGRADGDLAALVKTAQALRHIWCVAEREPIDLQTLFPVTLESQIPLLDERTALAALALSPLTSSILAELPCLPEGWRQHAEFADVVTYLEDTKTSLLRG